MFGCTHRMAALCSAADSLILRPGLRQAMATAGALVGASIAGLAYKLSGQNYTITFALATVPATLALLLTISVSRLTMLHHCVQAVHTYKSSEDGNLQPRLVDAHAALGSTPGFSSCEWCQGVRCLCRRSATQQSHRPQQRSLPKVSASRLGTLLRTHC